MSRIDALIDLRRPSSDGRAFVYLLPLFGEELLKLGFSRDPVVRMRTLHRRYFDFFDLERAWIVQTDRVREARMIEREFKQRVHQHRAPAPLEIRPHAGGDLEWYRGAYDTLHAGAAELAERGYDVHLRARPWLRNQLLARSTGLFEWSLQMCEQMQIANAAGDIGARAALATALRDELDALAALDIAVAGVVPDEVEHWYRADADRGACA